MSKKKTPTTDEEARKACAGCLHLEGADKCALLGLITLKIKQQCIQAGYRVRKPRRSLFLQMNNRHPRYPGAL